MFTFTFIYAGSCSNACQQRAYSTGCCDLTQDSCYSGNCDCFCDISCHLYGDCCDDIDSIGCSKPSDAGNHNISKHMSTHKQQFACTSIHLYNYYICIHLLLYLQCILIYYVHMQSSLIITYSYVLIGIILMYILIV